MMIVVLIPDAYAINNGTMAETAPYVVSVTKEDADGNRYGVCSGSLIAPRIVVTAGHCVTDKSGVTTKNVWVSPPGARWKEHSESGKQWRILEGTTSVAESRAIYERYRVVSIKITPSYNSSTNFVEDDDIAFLVLSQALPFDNKLFLPSDEETEDFIRNRLAVSIYGYGQTKFNDSLSLVPMTATMRLDSRSVRVINSANLSSATSDSCSGDSGGPVIVTFGEKQYLIGVISGGTHADSGPECSKRDGYGRYGTLITLVTKYANLGFSAALAAQESALLELSEAQSRATEAAVAEAGRLNAAVSELKDQIAALSDSLQQLRAELEAKKAALGSAARKLNQICKVRPRPRGC